MHVRKAQIKKHEPVLTRYQLLARLFARGRHVGLMAMMLEQLRNAGKHIPIIVNNQQRCLACGRCATVIVIIEAHGSTIFISCPEQQLDSASGWIQTGILVV
jgi:hypothetical protein